MIIKPKTIEGYNPVEKEQKVKIDEKTEGKVFTFNYIKKETETLNG